MDPFNTELWDFAISSVVFLFIVELRDLYPGSLGMRSGNSCYICCVRRELLIPNVSVSHIEIKL